MYLRPCFSRVPAVFALHFVDGLPGNDPQSYSFSRGGRRYVVSTVIQYDRDIQHFVTWTRTVDGGGLCTVLLLLLLDPSQILVSFMCVFLIRFLS